MGVLNIAMTVILLSVLCGGMRLKSRHLDYFWKRVLGLFFQWHWGSGSWIPPFALSVSSFIQQGEDLEEFEYTPGEEVAVLWDSLASQLSYGEHLTRHYGGQTSRERKLSDMVTTIVTVGEFRTNMFRETVPLEQRADSMAETVKSQNAALKERLRKISCFYKEQSEDGSYECQWQQGEGENLQEKTLSSCRKWERYRFPTELSEELTKWEILTQECQELEEKKNMRRQLLSKIDTRIQWRQEAESVLLELLFAAEEHVQDKVFFVLGASKEKESEDESMKSTLTMDSETSSPSDLHLFLDFGSHYSEGAGLQEYSTANGKIANLRVEKRDWVDVLKFTLYTADFRVEASLSMTVQEYVDLRFVGDIQVFYPDGSSSYGVMALELDFQSRE